MLFAAIDIGSNAGRLLFSNVTETLFKPKAEKASLIRIPLRLGFDVFEKGYISDEKIEDLIKTLKAFKLLIDVYRPISYRAVATAAMREAKNRKEVVKLVYKESGLNLEVIDGLTEARIVTANNENFNNQSKPYTMFIDVGGGSTEISLMNEDKLIDSFSFDIGTIRILKNTIEKKEWTKMEKWLLKYKKLFSQILVIGSGGNINKIKKLYANELDNFIYYEKLRQAYKELKSYSMYDRINTLGLRQDRADVIVPAAKIFIVINKIIKNNKIYIPKVGLSDGIIYELYHQQIKK